MPEEEAIPMATRQASLRELDEIYDKIIPFLRELDENPSLKSWFLSMEHVDPETRAKAFEKLARDSEVTDPESGDGKMFRLFQDPAIYTSGLHTLMNLHAEAISPDNLKTVITSIIRHSLKWAIGLFLVLVFYLIHEFEAKAQKVKQEAEVKPQDAASSVPKTEVDRYKAVVYKAIGSAWYEAVEKNKSALSVGEIRIKFHVHSNGTLDEITMTHDGGVTDAARNICLEAIRRANSFPAFTPRMIQQVGDYKGRSKSVTVGGAVENCDILLKRKDVYGSGVMVPSAA